MSARATVGAILFSVLVLLPGSAPALQDAAQHLQRGVELLDSNQVDAAIVELEQAVSLQPRNPRARYELGRALYAAGRYEDELVREGGRWRYASHRCVLDTRMLETGTHLPL